MSIPKDLLINSLNQNQSVYQQKLGKNKKVITQSDYNGKNFIQKFFYKKLSPDEVVLKLKDIGVTQKDAEIIDEKMKNVALKTIAAQHFIKAMHEGIQNGKNFELEIAKTLINDGDLVGAEKYGDILFNQGSYKQAEEVYTNIVNHNNSDESLQQKCMIKIYDSLAHQNKFSAEYKTHEDGIEISLPTDVTSAFFRMDIKLGTKDRVAPDESIRDKFALDLHEAGDDKEKIKKAYANASRSYLTLAHDSKKDEMTYLRTAAWFASKWSENSDHQALTVKGAKTIVDFDNLSDKEIRDFCKIVKELDFVEFRTITDFEMAKTLLQKNNYKEAEKYADRLYNSGKFKQAGDIYEELNIKLPNDQKIKNKMIDCKIRNGELIVEAQPNKEEETIQVNPNVSTALIHLDLILDKEFEIPKEGAIDFLHKSPKDYDSKIRKTLVNAEKNKENMKNLYVNAAHEYLILAQSFDESSWDITSHHSNAKNMKEIKIAFLRTAAWFFLMANDFKDKPNIKSIIDLDNLSDEEVIRYCQEKIDNKK